jgi:hypothetical protein
VANLPSIYTQGGTTTQNDSTTYLAIQAMFAAGTTDSIQTESIDNRSGLSRSITLSRLFAQNGGTGGTASTGCTTTTGTFGAAYGDGWRPSPQIHITCGLAVAAYFTTTQQSIDNAGNASATYKRTLAFDPGQPAVTGVSPNPVYVGNGPAPFTIGAQDDLEVIDGSLRIHYPGLTQDDGAGTPSDGLRWGFGSASGSMFATRFDASIVNPILPTGTVDQFTVSIQQVCNTAGFPGATCAPGTAGLDLGDPVPTTDITVAKPDSVGATVRDVFGSFVPNTTPGAATGVSAELASPILSGTVPAVGTWSVGYDATANCPQGGVPGGNCVTSGINFRADGISGSTYSYRATQDFNITLPMFTRADLFGLNAAGEWQFIQRITVPATPPTSGTFAAGAGTMTGFDNSFERYWIYNFTSVPAGFAAYRALGVNGSGHGLFSNSQ